VLQHEPDQIARHGRGGIVATNDDALAQSVRIAREYGNPGDYASVMPGLNARLPEWSAILGLANLRQLDLNAERRNEIAAGYRRRLGQLPGITFQQIRGDDRSSFKDFSIRVCAPERL
jgi:dTDP-4-amino-4,6-dideoxygalactose transaminase